MQLNEVNYGAAQPVEGYGPGFFRIAGRVWHSGLLIRPSEIRPWIGYDDAAPLLALAGEVDVLFIGTGSQMAYLPKGLTVALDAAAIGYEMMSSPAAARSYNVLLGEGRRIAAALLPVG